MNPFRRKPTRDEARAKARAAKMKPPKITIKGEPRVPFWSRWARPKMGRRLFVSVCWIAAWALSTWAAFDVFGPIAWKVGAAVLLVCAGGLYRLYIVVMDGLALSPPWEWFDEVDGE